METETRLWIGNRIRELRDKSGLTQAELAARLQKYGTTIGRIERGEVLPGIETIELIAQIFGTDLHGFFGTPDAPIKSGDETALMPGAHLLSASDRKLVQALIDRLVATGRG